MKHSARWTIVAIVLVGCVSASTLLGGSEPAASEARAARAYKPVQPIHEMMEGQKKLFGEIKDGIMDKSWGNASQSAWILAEVANANSFQSDKADYQSWASQMSSDCAELAKLLKKKDESGAKDLVTRIGQTCQSCHDKYQK